MAKRKKRNGTVGSRLFGAVNVKGYTYRRGGKIIRVTGHMRRKAKK